MAEHYDLGIQGEDDAVAYLIKKGYRIKLRNYRFAKAEIDIIAENDDWVVMVEVKTRTNDSFGNPEDFVSRKKQKHLIRAANHYAEAFDITKDIRFDIISILLQPTYSLEHIEEAFYP